jgi:hypothetical protein
MAHAKPKAKTKRPAADVSQSPAAIRMRRMRHRQRSGLTILPASDIGPDMVERLQEFGWLAPNRADDPGAAGDALLKLAKAALNAGAKHPEDGRILVAWNAGPKAIEALWAHRYLPDQPGKQYEPEQLRSALIDACNAAIGAKVLGKY